MNKLNKEITLHNNNSIVYGNITDTYFLLFSMPMLQQFSLNMILFMNLKTINIIKKFFSLISILFITVIEN